MSGSGPVEKWRANGGGWLNTCSSSPTRACRDPFHDPKPPASEQRPFDPAKCDHGAMCANTGVTEWSWCENCDPARYGAAMAADAAGPSPAPPEQPARDGVRTFTHAEYVRDPSPATQAALDGFRVVVLDSAGKPSLTFCGQPGSEERVFEGVVMLADGHDEFDHIETADGLVGSREMLAGTHGKLVRITVEVLDDAPGKDGG